jgi:hypothetical protein
MTRVLIRGESADLYDADTGEHVGFIDARGREVMTANWDSGGTALLAPDGAVAALSEAVAVVPLTATGTAFTGACEFRGFVVRAETGGTADVTIYDATSATGTPIMTVANISTGTYYWDGDHATPGVGTGGRRLNSTGCHVVIAGTCTIDVMVE